MEGGAGIVWISIYPNDIVTNIITIIPGVLRLCVEPVTILFIVRKTVYNLLYILFGATNESHCIPFESQLFVRYFYLSISLSFCGSGFLTYIEVFRFHWCSPPNSLFIRQQNSTLEFFTNYTKMPIFSFVSLLHKNKKIPVTKCYPQWE